MRLPKEWTPHTVMVSQVLGEGANGPIVSRPTEVPDVYVKDISEVTTDDTGAEIVSRATVRFNLADMPAKNSTVTVWPGESHEYEATVFKTSRLDHPGWPSLGVAWLR